MSVMFGKLFYLLVDQFPHRQNKDDKANVSELLNK
jgi:hypothetical protein